MEGQMSIQTEQTLLAVQRFSLGAAFSILSIAGGVLLLASYVVDLIAW